MTAWDSGIGGRVLCRLVLAPCAAVLLTATGCGSIGGFFGKSPSEKAQARALEMRNAAEQIELDEGEPQRLSVEERLEQGDRQRGKGKEQDALLTYLKAVRQDPSSPEPRERIGYIQLEHDTARARSIFRDVLELDPARASAQLGLGLSLIGEGRLDQAREAIAKAREAEPESPTVHYAWGVLASMQGDHEEARASIERALELDPDNAAMLNGLGVVHLLLDEYALAEGAFQSAIRHAPMVATYYNNLGLALGLQERFDESLSTFRMVGDVQAARNNLGYVYYLLGRYDDAVAQYELAMAAKGDQKAAILRNINAALDAREAAEARTSPASRASSPQSR